MIVGTAGHVDHGKTALVRALTGVDTDRLPEERRRGISIELGYAYTDLPGAARVGFVDVPGHERFVHTMLAGVTGIDFALLVIAADDGIMPQTIEHLQILDLLGVPRGLVVLTKIDRAEPSACAALEQAAQGLVAGTALDSARIVRTSVRTGAGIEVLRTLLAEAAAACRPRASADPFRLAVDRSFTLDGVGQVVTGTVFAGRVMVGDRLAVAPAGREVRVRGIHAQNAAAETGESGQRCALQLAGVARDEIRRGDWIVAPDSALATQRLDLAIRLLPGAPALVSGSALHLHLGAARAMARLIVLDADPAGVLQGGQAGFAQLVLDRPLAAWHGDRCVLRDPVSQRTLAGGRVLDPFAPARHRRVPARRQLLSALAAASGETAASAVIAQAECGVELATLARMLNLDRAALERALASAPPEGDRAAAVLYRPPGDAGTWAFDTGARERALARICAALDQFHAEHPDEPGLVAAALRRLALPRCEAALFRALLADLVAAGRLANVAAWWHRPDHRIRLGAEDERLARRLLRDLRGADAYDPPWVRDLAARHGLAEDRTRELLRKLARRADILQIVRDLFYHPLSVAELQTMAARLQLVHGEIPTGAFRDASGLGRKRAIQILEYFDRQAYTRRIGERRVLRDAPGTAPVSAGTAEACLGSD